MSLRAGERSKRARTVTVELPSEMLSGPDMGGGFLFQLTRDESPTPGFTFHAQEGGSDAGGPPRASPEPLGYAHPARPCPFGGPRCWHRSFALPAEAGTRVRVAYNRTRFAMEAMIDQVAEVRPVPAADGLAEFLDRVGEKLEAERVPWFLGGSGGAFAQGAAVDPHDLDIGTTTEGASRIAELLEEELIEPLAPESDPAKARWSARAFLGSFRSGLRIEWASVPESSPSGPREFLGREAWDRRRRIEWRGRKLWVAPIEFALARAAGRGRDERVRAIADTLAAGAGLDLPLLDGILAHSPLAKPARERLRRLVIRDRPQ